ncbi:tetratricopeptide repeat protein [Sphingobacterium spiritivorum]|uniref:type IX secretion system periplasmic lipoprotein PorW/SprE n=1 Tax=Sphingobacterium spiritivorum TaxID=258 RepID=UPI003DA3D76D
MKSYVRPVFAVLLCSVFLYACKSGQRRNNRNGKDVEEPQYNKVENFTSKYNILYNAKRMMADEQKAIARLKKENYQINLTVFDEPTAEGDPHQLMDSLVQKAYKIINSKQESKYVNEAYLIVGRANYMKGSYYTATEYFEYLKKNSAKQPEYRPIAYAWKSRSLLQIGKVEQAVAAVDSAFMFLDDNESTRSLVNAAKANLLVRTNKSIEAIPYLELASESAKSKVDRLRWKFLLAQLYKQKGEKEKAYQYFSKIARSNVSYDMAFEADLQAAFLQGEKGMKFEDRVKPLKRMLRDGKNEDYKDQIYYEIGNMYYAEGKEEEALAYYKLSLRQLHPSQYQTTETYLTMADQAFDKKQYRIAQNYYDSVATVLPNDYTNIDQLRRKLIYMKDLTQVYEEVAWQDTLLGLAALNDADLQQKLDEYASKSLNDKLLELELQKKDAKKGKKGGESQFRRTNLNDYQVNKDSYSDGKFYFNNQDAMLLGNSEFKRRWGNRPLSDNWRYSQSSALDLASRTQKTEADTILSERKKDKKEPEFDRETWVNNVKNRYEKAIPKNQVAYDSIHQIVHDDLIKIGNIYRDYTKDPTEAIKAYENFLDRYPNTPAAAEVYFSLYRMYEGIDKTKSLAYKNKLITLFPNTIHAHVAQDPYYLDKVKRDKETLDKAYARIFDLYANGDHVAVIQQVDQELQNTEDKQSIVAQLRYLQSLAVGRVGRVDDFVKSLSKIVTDFPNDSLVTPLAKENISFVNKNPDMFYTRVNALQDIKSDRIAFVDEPSMTQWPALSIDGDYRTGVALPTKKLPEKEKPKEKVVAKVEEKKIPEKKEEPVVKVEEKKPVEEPKAEEPKPEEKVAVTELSSGEVKSKVGVNGEINTNVELKGLDVKPGQAKIDLGPNDYRDKQLLPDKGVYFYVINVENATVNLAPSRYGIGQFNRTRYNQARIEHILRNINGENQLIFVGPFNSYEEVKAYETRISPLIPDIMKIPFEIYNTFVATKETIGTLTDGIQIKNYQKVYSEQ